VSSALLSACICGGRFFHAETVRFGYVMRCEFCETEVIDNDYSTAHFCGDCGVLMLREDPDDSATCEECADG